MEAFDNVAASTQALDASDAALDLAMSRWKGTAAQDESGITVSHGFLPNQALLSFCWAQEFKFSKNLLSTLLQLFDGSEQSAAHMTKWDSTYETSTVLKKFPNGDVLVHLCFNASPLSAREMVYMITHRKMKMSNEVVHEVHTFAYYSVDDEQLRSLGIDTKRFRRIRAENLVPSCDRLIIFQPEKGPKTIKLQHMMTTRLNGWIASWMYNRLLKGALIKQYQHEAKSIREYALQCTKAKK